MMQYCVILCWLFRRVVRFLDIVIEVMFCDLYGVVYIYIYIYIVVVLFGLDKINFFDFDMGQIKIVYW